MQLHNQKAVLYFNMWGKPMEQLRTRNNSQSKYQLV